MTQQSSVPDASLDPTLEYDVFESIKNDMPSSRAENDQASPDQHRPMKEQEDTTAVTDNEVIVPSFDQSVPMKMNLDRAKSLDSAELSRLSQSKIDLGKRGVSDLSARIALQPLQDRLRSDRPPRGHLSSQEYHYLTRQPPTKAELVSGIEDNPTPSTATYASRSTIESLSFTMSPNRGGSIRNTLHSPENDLGLESGSLAAQMQLPLLDMEFPSQNFGQMMMSLEEDIVSSLPNEDYMILRDMENESDDQTTGRNDLVADQADSDTTQQEKTRAHSRPKNNATPIPRSTRHRRQTRSSSVVIDTKDIRILFANYAAIKDIQRYIVFVEQMGATVVKDWENCTHCVTTELRRTRKISCAVASKKMVVSIKWLDESRKRKRFVDVSRFLLMTPSSDDLIFQNHEVFFTPSSQLEKDGYELVKAAGGKVLRSAPKSLKDCITVVTGDTESCDQARQLISMGYVPISRSTFLDKFVPLDQEN